MGRDNRCKAAIALAALWVVGCGDGGGEGGGGATGPAFVGERDVSAEIGRLGGTLELRSGLSVRIPEGALEEPVKLTVRELDADAARQIQRPSSGELRNPVVLTPHGTRFERAIDIKLPVREITLRDGSELRAGRLDDENDRTWEELKLEAVDEEGLRFKTTTFSVYGVIVVDVDAGGEVVPAPDADGGFGTATDGGAASSDAGGESDGAASQDASQPADSGSPPDAGVPDAGPPDSGSPPDAGVPDAGVPDAGDSGSPADAGIPDTGIPDTGIPDTGMPDAVAEDASQGLDAAG